MKKIIDVKVRNNTEVSDGVYRITLTGDDSAADEFSKVVPGQFVNLYLGDKSMLLPRPISICRNEKESLTLVYRVVGKGTKELSACREGEFVRISTPLGQGYDIAAVFKSLEEQQSSTATIALVAGGLGVPPMVELAKTIRKRIENGGSFTHAAVNYKLISMIGFQEKLFLTEELREFCDAVYIATVNGAAGFHGTVLEMMENQEIRGDYYLSCGPKPMMKALAVYCADRSKPLQVSLEERMGCGYGACVGCTCKTKEEKDGGMNINQKKVCKDGPVFFGDEVVWDE